MLLKREIAHYFLLWERGAFLEETGKEMTQTRVAQMLLERENSLWWKAPK